MTFGAGVRPTFMNPHREFYRRHLPHWQPEEAVFFITFRLKGSLPRNKIMPSLKRHTARKANIILGREGAFWQDESYDHLIRDREKFLRIISYVLENPVNAGLVSKREDWPWTFWRDTSQQAGPSDWHGSD